MMDFFSRGSRSKSANPMANAAAARAYAASLKQEFGASAHDKAAQVLNELNTPSLDLGADLLEAVLALNAETQPLHDALCVQYLMNARMPKTMEAQLRGQILAYGKEFGDFYQHALSVERNHPDFDRIRSLLPLVMARMMYYQCEYARWQYVRHYLPDEVFWLNLNQMYRLAEQLGVESTPVFLFVDQEGATTVQDQFLILHMLSALNSGNMSMRQLHFVYQLLAIITNRMSLTTQFSEDSSFVVTLNAACPATRPRGAEASETARYWSTVDLVEILHGWSIVMEAGRVPPEIKRLVEPGVDANLLRTLTREWSVKQTRFERAERQQVSNRTLEVAYRLPILHRLIRKPDEAQIQHARQEVDSYEDAANIRIYGFVTSRKRDKGPVPVPQEPAAISREVFPRWELENVSETGLGLSLDALGNEWVSLGSLVGLREGTEDVWGLAIVRRIRRTSRERIYLGVEYLSRRPVATSLRLTDARLVDPSLPPEQVWMGGHIALFMPYNRGGRVVNALVLPLSLYTLGRQYFMSARNKHFQINLGKVLEKGSDWCLVEIELVKTLDRLPVSL